MGKGTELRDGGARCQRWDVTAPVGPATITHITFIPDYIAPNQPDGRGLVLTIYFNGAMGMAGTFNAHILTLPGVSAPWIAGEDNEHTGVHHFIQSAAYANGYETSGTAGAHCHLFISDPKSAKKFPDDWFTLPSALRRVAAVIYELEKLNLISSAETKECLAFFKV